MKKLCSLLNSLLNTKYYKFEISLGLRINTKLIDEALMLAEEN